MNRILRLTSYGRKYWPQILLSVILMAIAGASQGLIPLLIPPIFDRVLLPNSPNGPIPLLPRPLLGHQFYLDDILPLHGRSVWTMVATALLLAFFLEGHLRLRGQLPGQLRRLRQRHPPAQRRLRKGAQTGRRLL